MRKRLSPIPLILALLLLAGLPTAASADYRKVYTDCADGTVDGHYSAKELQQALQNLEGNLSDYSDCADAIVRAQNGAPKKQSSSGDDDATSSSGGSASSGGSGGAGGDDDDPTSLGAARSAPHAEIVAANAATEAAASQDVQDGSIDLQDVHVPASALQLGAARTDLPLPLLIALIAGAAAALLAGATTGLQALRRHRGH